MKYCPKIIAFVLTFLGYASLHALREGWSYSKTQINNEFGISLNYLGIVDALYLIFYSGGMAILGSQIHRISLKSYIIMGLVLSSCSYMLFAVIYGLTSFYNVVFMTIFMCINGFFQATGWPGMMGIFGNWFQKNKKGCIMGIWAMNANFGNIVASNLCNMLQDHNVNWIWNFILTGLMAIAVAVLMFFTLKEKPSAEDEEQEVNQQDQNLKQSMISSEQDQTARNNQIIQTTDQQNQAQENVTLKYGIFSVLCLPRVPAYVIGYSCLKGCVYGLLFWLPTFFDSKGEDISNQKGYISAMIDIGSLIGGTFVGYLSDRFDKRALFLSPLLFLSSVTMFVVSFALTDQAWQYYIAMFLIGNFIGGPYNIIGTVIAIDIGNRIKQKGSVTKVSSLIEGSAALFTAIEMIFIPHIDFDYIFYLFAAECIVATAVLTPPFINELRSLFEGQHTKLVEQGATSA